MKMPELPYLLQQPPLQTAYNHKQDKHIHMHAVNKEIERLKQFWLVSYSQEKHGLHIPNNVHVITQVNTRKTNRLRIFFTIIFKKYN